MLTKCPKCGSQVGRGRRSEIMRMLSEKLKVYRYRCKSRECGWESIVLPDASKKKLRNYLLIAICIIFLLAICFSVLVNVLNATQN